MFFRLWVEVNYSNVVGRCFGLAALWVVGEVGCGDVMGFELVVG